jgi:hypothetical protein
MVTACACWVQMTAWLSDQQAPKCKVLIAGENSYRRAYAYQVIPWCCGCVASAHDSHVHGTLLTTPTEGRGILL